MTQLKLSKRALASMDVHKPMSKMFTDALPLLCNCTLNPTGAINLGVAHNDLMRDELLEKLSGEELCTEIECKGYLILLNDVVVVTGRMGGDIGLLFIEGYKVLTGFLGAVYLMPFLPITVDIVVSIGTAYVVLFHELRIVLEVPAVTKLTTLGNPRDINFRIIFSRPNHLSTYYLSLFNGGSNEVLCEIRYISYVYCNIGVHSNKKIVNFSMYITIDRETSDRNSNKTRSYGHFSKNFFCVRRLHEQAENHPRPFRSGSGGQPGREPRAPQFSYLKTFVKLLFCIITKLHYSSFIQGSEENLGNHRDFSSLLSWVRPPLLSVLVPVIFVVTYRRRKTQEKVNDNEQQDKKRTSSFTDYYFSCDPNTINNDDIFSWAHSVKELIKLEKERFELEDQLYSKTK
ncbi:hypothetical protein K501DRAFT_269016 [Backusella circina FSU 941]|nr:hypothetical protein K501DRAFT_269016 [Backusella circina FSU 941]